MSKIEIVIDSKLMMNSGLSVIQYLTLGYLRESTKLIASLSEQYILNVLEDKGYIRIVDEHIIVDSSAETIFETEFTTAAKEILTYYNSLKKEHLNISRATRAQKYVVKLKGLLVGGFELDYIKEVLTYLFTTWKNDPFMKKYLGSIDTLVRHFDKYSNEYEMNKNEFINNKNTML